MFDALKKNAAIYVSLEETDQVMTWCDDCGNYAIQKALFQALTLERKKPSETIVAYDVGCSGNESDKVGLTTIHGLHGRVLPLATGIKIAHPEITNKNPHQSTKTIVRRIAMRRSMAIPTVMSSSRV